MPRTDITRHRKRLLNVSAFAMLILIMIILVSRDLAAQTLVGKITLGLNLEKRVYIENEMIWPELVVRNLTDQPVTIPRPIQHGALRVALKDHSGSEISNGIISESILGTDLDTIVIPAGGFVIESVSLAGFVNRRGGFGIRLVTGAYSVQTFLGDVSSPPVQFQISEIPTGEQQVSRRIRSELVTASNNQQAIQSARAIIRDFPKSVYLPEVYDWLLIYLRISNISTERSDDLLAASVELLDRYPNSGWALHAVNGYQRGLRNKLGVKKGESLSPDQQNSIKEKLSQLARKYPSERISRYVDTIVNNMKHYEAHPHK